MAAFLLWNVHKKPLDSLVRGLVRQHNIEVVLLVEYAFGLSQLSNLLPVEGLYKRYSSKKFAIFTPVNHRLRRLNYKLGRRVCFWEWTPPGGQPGLIVLLHGFDRRNYDDSSRRLFLRRVADAVRRREKGRHQRTIVAGDFNANPFESAMAGSDGLHAIGVRSIKAQPSRSVRAAGGVTDFFYNPMWRLYGQQPQSEAGSATHYWTKEWVHELAWHMLDQVVVRPGEISRFPEDELRIISRVGNITLLDVDGVPDKQTASDHLPVVFHWNL